MNYSYHSLGVQSLATCPVFGDHLSITTNANISSIYSTSGFSNGGNIILAEGTGSLVDLSTFTQLNAEFNSGFSSTQTQVVKASDGGTVNLSNLQNIAKPFDAEDRLDFIIEGATSQIDLSSLDTITGNGRLFFNITDGTLLLGSYTNDYRITTAGSGQITLSGDYTQAPTAILDLQLSGPTSTDPTLPDPHSKFTINGAAALDGTLNVTLADGYMPEVGDRFDIITATATTGTFTTQNLPELDEGKVWQVEYSAEGVSLIVV